MRSYDGFLVILGILALLSVPFAPMSIILWYSVVGIPLAIVMHALPAIATLLIFGRLLELRLFFIKTRPVIRLLGIGLAFSLLALPSAISNARLDAKVTELIESDFNTLELPLPRGIYALQYTGSDGGCYAICRDLLLSGTATEVRIALSVTTATDPQMPVTAWRIERRATCANDESTAQASDTAQRVPPDEMPIRIASGRCLVKAERQRLDADVVIAFDQLLQAAPPDELGFSLASDVISANRTSVHQRQNGVMTMTYRATGVVADRIWHIAVPTTLNQDNVTKPALGFFRKRITTNGDAFYFGRIYGDTFLIEVLQLPLLIDADSAHD